MPTVTIYMSDFAAGNVKVTFANGANEVLGFGFAAESCEVPKSAVGEVLNACSKKSVEVKIRYPE